MSKNSFNKFNLKWGLIFISPWLLGFLMFYLTPMLASFGFTLNKINLANPMDNRFIGFENWERALFHDKEVYKSIYRIFVYGLISLPIGFLFSMSMAFILNSKHLIGKKLFRVLFYLPTMIPFVASVIIWKGVLNEYTGWINLILENVFHIKAIGSEGIKWITDSKFVYYTYTMMGLWGMGNMIIVIMAGLQKVPTEYYEAASIDGAGWWKKLFKITIPQISPIIFFNVLISIVMLLQYFLTPFVLNNGNRFPNESSNFIMVYFYRQAFTYFNMGYGAVLAWIIFFIALLITLILFRTSKPLIYYEEDPK